MARRLLDVAVSSVVVVLMLPLWLVASVMIKVDTKGPVLYRSPRVGKDGRPFTILKFRSMVARADAEGPRVTTEGDPRITRVGRVLRDLKIDEIPQFLNVLKGDMSLVGPRPEDPRYVAHYTVEQRRVLSVRPGIVSPAAIAYRHEEAILARLGGGPEDAYLETVLPHKLSMDLAYIDQRSLGLDLTILTRALLSIFTNERSTGT